MIVVDFVWKKFFLVLYNNFGIVKLEKFTLAYA